MGKPLVVGLYEVHIERIARSIAESLGQDPDMQIAPGMPQRVALPCYGTEYHAASSYVFPLWKLFVPAARAAAATLGDLTGVSYELVVEDKDKLK